jgi:hypothetical protein
VSRSARCFIPSSILRSITSDPGSIGNIPMRAVIVSKRKRLRLMGYAVGVLEQLVTRKP